VGYGYFFSVWKLQPDGTWKVILDCGIRTPGAGGPVAPVFRAPPGAGGAGTVQTDAERSALLTKERSLGRHGSGGELDDFVRLLDDDARLHRSGTFPVVGKQAIRDFLAVKLLALKWEPIHADVARSGDLAYTYGSYELKGSGEPRGYYAHVWRRRSPRDWKIILDTAIP
jgi:ketosteroid isomerase-like protein